MRIAYAFRLIGEMLPGGRDRAVSFQMVKRRKAEPRALAGGGDSLSCRLFVTAEPAVAGDAGVSGHMGRFSAPNHPFFDKDRSCGAIDGGACQHRWESYLPGARYP